MKYQWYSIKLVIVCVIVFILQNIYPFLTDELSLVSAELFSKPWMIITYMFVHGSLEHLFYNMIALALFGSILEKVIGGKNFLFIFFLSGIIAGFGSFLFYTASLGASGAIMGVMGTLGILRPRMTVYVSFIPMPMSVAVLLWAAGDLIGFFDPLTEIAHIAHLAGLATGLLYGLRLKKTYGERYARRIKYSNIGEKEFEEWEDRWL